METEVKLAFKDKECLFSAVSTDWFKSRCQNPDNRAVTLENIMLLNLEFDIKIAVRTAVGTGLALASYREKIACIDACRDRN